MFSSNRAWRVWRKRLQWEVVFWGCSNWTQPWDTLGRSCYSKGPVPPREDLLLLQHRTWGLEKETQSWKEKGRHWPEQGSAVVVLHLRWGLEVEAWDHQICTQKCYVYLERLGRHDRDWTWQAHGLFRRLLKYLILGDKAYNWFVRDSTGSSAYFLITHKGNNIFVFNWNSEILNLE